LNKLLFSLSYKGIPFVNHFSTQRQYKFYKKANGKGFRTRIFTYCGHGECNSHVLRYLIGVDVFTKHTWSKEMGVH